MILLIPIFAFILIYFLSLRADLYGAHIWPFRLASSGIVAINWTMVLFFFPKKIKSIPIGQGLRLKLEKYFQLTIVRYRMIIFVCLILAGGFYITHDDFITGLFAVNLIFIGFIWPTASKVCNDLKLRGDEREMVYYKKDSF
jgi:hypothetical protein